MIVPLRTSSMVQLTLESVVLDGDGDQTFDNRGQEQYMQPLTIIGKILEKIKKDFSGGKSKTKIEVKLFTNHTININDKINGRKVRSVLINNQYLLE